MIQTRRQRAAPPGVAPVGARPHDDEETINAGPLVDLRHSTRLADSTQWRLVVHAGLLGSTGMPGFMAELDAADAKALRAYVLEQAYSTSQP